MLKNKITLKTVLWYALTLVISFLLSFSEALGRISPLGIAFVAALPNSFTPIGLIGASIGYFMCPEENIVPIRYVATLFIITVIRSVTKDSRFQSSSEFIAAVTAFSCMATSLTVMFSTRFKLGTLLIFILEALLSAGAAYFFEELFKTRNRISTIVSGALFLLSLTGIEFWFINLSLVALPFLVMLFLDEKNKLQNIGITFVTFLAASLGTGSKVPLFSFIPAAIIYIIIPCDMLSVIKQSLLPADENTRLTKVSLEGRLRSLSDTIIRISDLLCDVSEKTNGLFPEDAKTAIMRDTFTRQIKEAGAMLRELSESKEDAGDMPQEAFEVELGMHQVAAKCNRRCGDYFKSFETDDGKFYMLLSDGMGTGAPAALCSALSVEVMQSLIKEGMDFPHALGITNTAMMLNSADEALATVDMACIDLSTGRADFYKAGAAATLVRHGRRVLKLNRIALPIGILGEAEYSHASATLSRDDIILMSSDGVWVTDEVSIAKQLSYFKGEDMDTLSKRIADIAFEKGTVTDDITVIAARLLQAESL